MVRLAFYKRVHPQAGRLAKWIDFFSGRRGYYHVELVFSDGMSFSSSSVDDVYIDGVKVADNGPRFKRIDYGEHPDRWDLVDLPQVTPRRELIMRRRAEAIVREAGGYDFYGVLRFLPIVGLAFKQHETAWFCSEVVVRVLRAAGLFPPPPPDYRVSPNDLAVMVGLVK